MHFIGPLLLRSGGLSWFNLVFLAVAGVIVYPEVVLQWLSQKTGKILGVTALVILEACAIGILVATVTLFAPTHPRLHWWNPVLAVGIVVGVRALRAAVESLLK